jgi:hypothetical protein
MHAIVRTEDRPIEYGELAAMGLLGDMSGLTLVASGTARGWICVLIRRENRVALACRLEVHNFQYCT